MFFLEAASSFFIFFSDIESHCFPEAEAECLRICDCGAATTID